MKIKKYILGIGGHIGSGKTTAGNFFEKLGAYFIDADDVVEGLYQKGEDGYRKILSFFGEEYLTSSGELNRKKLAKAVFGDPKKLRILHDLVHPLVTSKIQRMVDKSNEQYIVVEATYFEKKHLQSLVDAILWIDCPKNVLFERLHKDRKLERALFEKILRIQIKPSVIDFAVDNSGSKKDFEQSLRLVWDKIRKG